MKRILYLAPLVITLILFGFFLLRLTSGADPSAIPSVLISKPVPQFELAGIETLNTKGLKTEDLQTTRKLTAVNFFASWCVPCRAEHAVLDEIAKTHSLTLMGVNYKDQPDAAAKWLTELGNIYDQIGADITGRTAIDWGVSGVPETFLVRDGVVVFRFLGPIVGATARRDFEAAILEAKQ